MINYIVTLIKHQVSQVIYCVLFRPEHMSIPSYEACIFVEKILRSTSSWVAWHSLKKYPKTISCAVYTD